MGNFIPIKGNDTNINNHPTSDGQLLFTTDSGKLFLDSNNKRIEITDFINLDKINPFPNNYTYFENKIYIQNNKLHLWDPINRTLNQIAKSENKIVYATIFTNDNSGVLSDFYSTNGTLNQEHGIYGIVKNYAGEIEVGTFVISEDTRTFGICKGKASDFNINQSNGYIVEIISDDTSFISQPNLTKEYYFSNNNNFYRNGSIKYPYNENDFSKFINNNNVLFTGANVNIYVGNNVSLNISILNELNLEIQNVNFIGINKQTCSVIIPNLGNENINDSSILTNASFTNLTIDLENDLSSGILSISNCENLTFNDCLFKNIYKFRHCTGIFIQNCNSIDRNEKTNEIYFESCKNIEIKNSNNISKFTFKDEELEQNTDEYNEELNYSVDKPILLLKNVDCNEIKIDYKSLSKENKLILLSNVNINSTIDIKTVSFIKFTSGKLLKESTSTIKIITNSDKLDLGSFDYSNAANIFIDDDFKYNLQGLSTRQVYNDSVEYNINDVPEQNELFYRKQYKLNHQIDADNLDDRYDEKLDTSKSLHSDLIKIDEQLKKNHDKIQTVNDTFEEFSNNLTDDYALKSYVGVKTVSGGTAENPLKITSLQSDLPVVIRGGYLAFNNPSDDDNYSITIHCITDSEPIIVLHTDVLYDAFDTGEPIEYVGDIVMLRNDIYGLYHYSIDAETGETTFTHNDGSNSDFNDETPSYTQITLNSTAATGLKNGLCKFEFTGRANVKGYSYNPIASELNGKYVPIQHLMGNLKILYSDNIATNIIPIDLFGREAESKTDANGETCTFASCYDIFTEKYLQRNWSDDFFIKDSFTYSNNILDEETIGNNGNVLHKFTIPASAFGDQLPKNDKSNLRAVSPMGFSRSYNWLKAYQSQCNSSQPYVSMTYNSEEDTYLVCFLTRNNVTTKSDLLKSKVYIKYELRNPIYDYHTFKIYAKNGMRIIFEKIPVTTNDNSVNNYIDASSNVYLVTQNVYAPTNKTAILEGFEQTTTNINDLNKRVDNIEITSSKIGVGDGSLDDHDAIQDLIDNAEDTVSGLIHDIKIPEGIYRLDNPLILEKSNVRLIGDGKVILKPSGNFPAIIVRRIYGNKLEDVSIENINIHLPDIAYSDDESAPYIYNGVTILKGRHSGIYLDGTYGNYRINISDITIEGIYRNYVENDDKSYGIMINNGINVDNSQNYNYFCTITNVNLFSLYCGLYLDSRSSNAKVSNLHWDSGENIYKHPGRIFATHGVGYGIYCTASYCVIDYRGQASGYFEYCGWCYKDKNNNEYSLIDVVGNENVYSRIVDNELIGYYFKDNYSINAETTISTDTSHVDLFLTPKTLSKCNVYCGGSKNYITGHCFDPQRTDYYYYFDNTSSDNRYYYSTEDCIYGEHREANSDLVWYYESDIDKSKDQLNDNNYYAYFRNNVEDLGTNNVCINTSILQNESMTGGIYLNTAGNDKISYHISKHFGLQDNVLSYLYEHANISVYQIDSRSAENSLYIKKCTVNGVDANKAIKAIFNPECKYLDDNGNIIYSDFEKGITFDESASYSNPIYIDIKFKNDFKINKLSRFGIKFNDYIASDIAVLTTSDIIDSGYTDENGEIIFRDINNNVYKVYIKYGPDAGTPISNIYCEFNKNNKIVTSYCYDVPIQIVQTLHIEILDNNNNPIENIIWYNSMTTATSNNNVIINKYKTNSDGISSSDSKLIIGSINDEMWRYQHGLRSKFNKHASFTSALYLEDHNGVHMLDNITGLRIMFSQAYSIPDPNDDDPTNLNKYHGYNVNNKIGLSQIWATDNSKTGNTWLAKGGGELYGDLDLRNNYITIGNINELPEASEMYRGKLIMIKDDVNGDKLYTCLKIDSNTYTWNIVGDITSDNLLSSIKNIDGSGSGINADFVDGKHVHQLAQYGTANGTLVTTGNPGVTATGGSQMYRFYDSSNLIGEGTDKYYGIMQIYYSASYYVRIAVSMSSGKVYRQTNGASSWSELTPHIPVLSTDPSNPSEGQMWILNSN